MNVIDTDAVVSLVSVLDETLAPLESLIDILASGGHEDVASVSAGLLRDARAQLQAVVRCLEAGCGHKLMLRDLGGALAPMPCPYVKEKDLPAS